MHYASVESLSKSFGVRKLFSEITFHISEGDKIALIARNGFGKSTLLKILNGRDHADSGEVWVHKDIRIVMLEQENEFKPESEVWDHMMQMNHEVIRTVKAYDELMELSEQNPDTLQHLLSRMDELQAWNLEHLIKQILSKLNITQLHQKMGSLSGGQKKRVALAQALIEAELYSGKCLLIMDEPTNHLDVRMIEWLEDHLSSQKITLLMVTHDRYFLDAVCNEIIEIEDEQVYIHKGNYEYFLQQKAHRIEVANSELLKDKNIFRKELEWMRKQPRARTTKSKSRQDAFGDLKEKVSQKKVDTDVQLQVKMTRLGGKILELKKVYKSFGDLHILKGFDYTFKRGERIGIAGKNGVGKSTFLQIALQLMPPDSGKINHGETVVFGHFSQDGLSYTEDKRVIEYVKDFAEFFPLSDGTKISASKFLERFAFSAEQQYTFLSKLSGGEKRRLQLLSILFKNPNFLVLDEPTNDLDLQTLQILEEFLLEYQGCILLVSHDRYFMDKLAEHLFVFEGDGVIRDFPGNYSQYRIAEAQEKSKIEPASVKVPEVIQPTSANVPKEKKLSFKEKREFELLGQEIPQLEEEKKKLEATMAAGTLPYEELQTAAQRVGELLSLLEEKELRWLELSEWYENSPN